MQMPLVLTNRRRRGGSASAPAFSPSSLFSSGSQGIWLDPSDLSTMFSDRAGTTPVTTPGTVVGLRLDKSKGLTLGAEQKASGTVAIAGTATAATYNTTTGVGSVTRVDSSNQSFIQWSGLTANSFYRVDISCQTNGVILRTGTQAGTSVQTVTAGQSLSVSVLSDSSGRIAITNTTAANTSTFTVSSVRELAGNHAVAPTDAARPIYGVEPKGGRRNLLLATDTLATQSLTVTAVAHTLAFTGTGTVTLSGASIAGPLIGTGASDRVSLTFTPTAASLTLTVVGSVTLGQLELGSSATAYQKVVTAYNVTEAGVATTHYVQFDGSDDSMSTAAIDFTATDKMSVFAGVRKLSDAAAGMLMELSATAVSNSGAFAVGNYNPSTGTPSSLYNFISRGSVYPTTAPFASGYAAPTSNVLSGLGDISGDTSKLRVNGTQVAQDTGDQGTGTFGNYPLYIGRRNNATLPFNGRDYGIIIVGKTASAGEITDTETWLAAKTAQVTI